MIIHGISSHYTSGTTGEVVEVSMREISEDAGRGVSFDGFRHIITFSGILCTDQYVEMILLYVESIAQCMCHTPIPTDGHILVQIIIRILVVVIIFIDAVVCFVEAGVLFVVDLAFILQIL